MSTPKTTKEIASEAREELTNLSDRLSAEMWASIHVLINESYDDVDKQLDAVIAVGRQAQAIRAIRTARGHLFGV